MNKYALIALCCTTAIFACSSPANKKVLIMGSGSIAAIENNITMKDGSGYAEETVELSGDKSISWNVTTSAGKTTVDIPGEKGFYILNLKNDTIVGSQQILGTDISSSRTITQEELKMKIDSLTKLTTGSNISSTSHNYMILPNQIKKISENPDARVFGPYTKISRTLEKDKNGKVPEIYKFYTNSGMRELIGNFKKMTMQ